MNVIVLIGLVRLIPYLIVTYQAYKKGYRWLTAFGVYISANAILNTFAQPDAQIRAVIASVSAFLLMMHALNIPPKGGEK